MDASNPAGFSPSSERPVVSNTTPIINLVGVGLLDLLPALYGDIWVPEGVLWEYSAGMRSGDPRLDELTWITIIPSVSVLPGLSPNLGTGEAQAISLAIAQHARAILLDEQLARATARQLSLPVVGTLGVLVAAKQTGLLPDVKPVLDMMLAQGRHISDTLYAQILKAADENT